MPCALIDDNPSFKKPILVVLAAAQDVMASEPYTDRAQVEAAATKSWRDEYRRSAAVVVDMLVRNGYLAEEVLVDGEPYDGTLESIQLDLSIPDDADAQSHLALTEQGQRALEEYAPSQTLRKLLDEKSKYADVFAAVLSACDVPDGLSRMEVEDVINEFPQLKPDAETKQTKVFPQFFLDSLESAGGIAWDGAWKTTPAGREAAEW